MNGTNKHVAATCGAGGHWGTCDREINHDGPHRVQQILILRPSWDEYFLDIASAVSRRATCPRASVGVVFVDSRHRIVSTGYNGSPPGQPHCIAVGCLMVDNHCARVTHAEANAVAYGGRDLDGSTLYIHGYPPCHVCAKLVVTAGVVRIVWRGEKAYTETHKDDPAAKMLAEAGVKLERAT